MNEQSVLLQQMFKRVRPNPDRTASQHSPHSEPIPVPGSLLPCGGEGLGMRGFWDKLSINPPCHPAIRSHCTTPPLQWLLHTCTVGLNLIPMAQACEAALSEMGWETTALMAERWSAATETAVQTHPRPQKAFVVATTSDEIQPARITGTPSVIFVLDTTPASLIKTYSQIKTLIGQRYDLGSRVGMLFVAPFGNGRERLLSSCQRFLCIRPIDLGTISRSLVLGAERSWPGPSAEDWRTLVARCLHQLPT